MGWSDTNAEDDERPHTLGHCGIDIDEFERIVEQNNYGTTGYHDRLD